MSLTHRATSGIPDARALRHEPPRRAILGAMADTTRRSGAVFVHDDALESALRHVRADDDVVVIGDVGSGRSTVLAALTERLRGTGTSVVALAGSDGGRDIPLAAFGTHPVLRPRAGARWGLPEATATLAEAVGTGPAVVLVDDAHLLDDASTAVLGAVARRHARPVGLVLSAPVGVDLGTRLPDLARGAVVTHVAPLGVSAMSALLADRLAGQVEGHLASVVAGRSGGNPRVAVALVQAAIDAGVVTRVRGRWAQSGALDLVRADAVALALLTGMPEPLARALDVLAWFGLVDVGTARQLLGADTLAALDRAGRVVVHEGGQEATVAVSPPALGQALRLRLSPAARADLRARADAVLGSGVPGPPVLALPAGAEPLTPDAPDGTAHQQVAILTESVRTQASQRYRTWLERRDLVNALSLLRLRLLDNLASIDVDEIFGGTVPSPADDPDDVGSYVLLRGQWAAATGGSVRYGMTHDPGPTGRLVLPDLDERFLSALERLYTPDPTAVGVAELAGVPVPDSLRDFVLILQVQAAVETGAPDRALELLGDWTASRHQRVFGHQLDSLRADALLLSGHVEDAIAWSRERLSAAYDELSLIGVRLAARGLATALFVDGDHEGARRTLSLVLQMGRCGPVQSPYDERILGLAATLRARAGEVDLAAALLDELQATPRPYLPALDFVRPWAATEVAYFRSGGDHAPDGTPLWDAGEEQLATGRLASAVLCWAFAPLELTPERLARLESLCAQTRMPVVRPLVHLHRTLVHGSSDDVLAALAELRVSGPLVHVALGVAHRRSESEGRGGLTEDQVRAVAGAAIAAAARRAHGPTAPLTTRETQIAALAREGLSNRQIAGRLYLSVRTVESHLYRAMQKLRVSDRALLRGLPESALVEG